MIRLNPFRFLGEKRCSSICPKKSTENSIQMVSAQGYLFGHSVAPGNLPLELSPPQRLLPSLRAFLPSATVGGLCGGESPWNGRKSQFPRAYDLSGQRLTTFYISRARWGELCGRGMVPRIPVFCDLSGL